MSESERRRVNVIALRKEGYTHQEIAQRVGLTRGYVTRILSREGLNGFAYPFKSEILTKWQKEGRWEEIDGKVKYAMMETHDSGFSLSEFGELFGGSSSKASELAKRYGIDFSNPPKLKSVNRVVLGRWARDIENGNCDRVYKEIADILRLACRVEK